MIPKITSTALVYEMIGIDISKLVARNAANSEEKWEARKERRQPDLVPNIETPNYLKGIPNDWCQILKQQCSICPLCKKSIRSQYHMSSQHKVDIYDYKEIWENIKNYHDRAVRIQRKKSRIMKVKRTEFLEYWEPRLKQLKEDTANKYDLLYARIKT